MTKPGFPQVTIARPDLAIRFYVLDTVVLSDEKVALRSGSFYSNG